MLGSGDQSCDRPNGSHALHLGSMDEPFDADAERTIVDLKLDRIRQHISRGIILSIGAAHRRLQRRRDLACAYCAIGKC